VSVSRKSGAPAPIKPFDEGTLYAPVERVRITPILTTKKTSLDEKRMDGDTMAAPKPRRFRFFSKPTAADFIPPEFSIFMSPIKILGEGGFKTAVLVKATEDMGFPGYPDIPKD
jgi:hypothetical protein